MSLSLNKVMSSFRTEKEFSSFVREQTPGGVLDFCLLRFVFPGMQLKWEIKEKRFKILKTKKIINDVLKKHTFSYRKVNLISNSKGKWLTFERLDRILNPWVISFKDSIEKQTKNLKKEKRIVEVSAVPAGKF